MCICSLCGGACVAILGMLAIFPNMLRLAWIKAKNIYIKCLTFHVKYSKI